MIPNSSSILLACCGVLICLQLISSLTAACNVYGMAFLHGVFLHAKGRGDCVLEALHRFSYSPA